MDRENSNMTEQTRVYTDMNQDQASHCLSSYLQTHKGQKVERHVGLELKCNYEFSFFNIYTHSLEKAMAAHSSTLAWKIPLMEEPGRLQSMRLPRVGHN